MRKCILISEEKKCALCYDPFYFYKNLDATDTSEQRYTVESSIEYIFRADIEQHKEKFD